MSDSMTINDGRVVIKTEEGTYINHPTDMFERMLVQENTPPIGNLALPDGVKFITWRPPTMVVCHQQPACVRLVRWIAPDSKKEYGEGVKYTKRRLSVPYAITFAHFTIRNGQLRIVGENEIYFSNAPIVSLDDKLCYPALLNVSVMGDVKKHTWVCTQYLDISKTLTWVDQLQALLAHIWSGGFNRSSEHNEGESWYGLSSKQLSALSPIEKWERLSKADDGFGLTIDWLKSPFTVGDVINHVSGNARQHIVRRFIRFAGAKSTIKEKVTADLLGIRNDNDLHQD